MSIKKLKAAFNNQIVRWSLALSLLTSTQAGWYLLAGKMPSYIYIAVSLALTASVQIIHSVYGKQIEKYKASISETEN